MKTWIFIVGIMIITASSSCTYHTCATYAKNDVEKVDIEKTSQENM